MTIKFDNSLPLLIHLPSGGAHKVYNVRSKNPSNPESAEMEKMLYSAVNYLGYRNMLSFIEDVGTEMFLKFFNVDAVDGSRAPVDWKAVGEKHDN